MLHQSVYASHSHGSSHGQSRIIRQAYYESPFYVPLLKEAYTIWDEVEKVSDKKLFLKTGGLMLFKCKIKILAKEAIQSRPVARPRIFQS